MEKLLEGYFKKKPLTVLLLLPFFLIILNMAITYLVYNNLPKGIKLFIRILIKGAIVLFCSYILFFT